MRERQVDAFDLLLVMIVGLWGVVIIVAAGVVWWLW